MPKWQWFSYDKLGHFGLFGILSFLLALAINYESKAPNLKKRIFVFTVGAVSLYGVIIELVQSKVPGRNASFPDVIANLIGALLGFWIFSICHKFLKANGEK